MFSGNQDEHRVTNRSSYDFRIRARARQTGIGDLLSDWVEVSVDATAPPRPPRQLRVTAGNAELGVRWVVPPTGDEVTGYDVQYTSLSAGFAPDTWPALDESEFWRYRAGNGWVAFPRTGTTASQTISGLAPGTTYRVRVRARNSAGAGDWVVGRGTTPYSTATISFAVSTLRVIEGSVVPDLRLQLSRPLPNDVSLTLPVTAGSAESGDYQIATSSITIPAGQLYGLLSSGSWANTVDDADEDDETFIVSLPSTLPSSLVAGSPSSATVTIADDDGKVRVSFAEDSMTLCEGGPQKYLPELKLSRQPDSIFHSIWLTGDAGAAEPHDHTFLYSAVISSRYTSEYFRQSPYAIRAHQDGDDDFEDFTVEIDTSRLPDGFLEASPSKVAVTIVDDDLHGQDGCNVVPPKISVADDAVSERAERDFMRFVVTLDRAGPGLVKNMEGSLVRTDDSVTVFYQTVSGTAQEGADFTPKSGTLVFEKGRLRKEIHVPVLDDNVEDSGETFRLVLSNPQGGIIERGEAIGTIFNHEDDPQAELGALSVEGAPGAGGPFAKLDIGTFAAGTTAYAVTVPHGTTHARLTATVGGAGLTLRSGAGSSLTAVQSGAAGAAIPLSVGSNALKVEATAPSGVSKTYTVTVTRQAAAPAAVAVSLSATPNPVVEGSPVTVTATLAEALEKAVTIPLTVTRGTSEDGDHGSLASITLLAGFKSAAGTVSTTDDDDGDDETFTVALGGLPSGLVAGTASSVEVTITDSGRQRTAPLTLSGLSGSTSTDGSDFGGTLDIGTFAPGTTEYAATVGNAVTHVKLTATAGESGATVKVGTGSSLAAVADGTASGAIALSVGANALKVEVTAEDGTVKTYTVTVTREERALSSDATLSALAAEAKADGTWTALDVGTFASATTSYSATVPNGTTHVRLTATAADAKAMLKAGAGSSLTAVASGSASGAIALDVGANALKVEVTAENGTIRTYAVAVTRQAAPLTARLRGTVAEHDGETAFMLELELSESLDSGSRWPSASSFNVKGGSVESVRRFRPYRFQVQVRPKSWKDVTVTLEGGRACGEEGAICTADGRSVSNTATLTVSGPVRIRVAGARAEEGKDATLDFAVTLNRAAAHEVSVDYATKDETATAGLDYTATSGTLVFAAGVTERTVSVPVLDDSVDEGKEIMRLKLSNPKGAYLRGVHAKARGIIINHDPLPGAWLSRFGRTVAGHHVAAIRDRLAADRSPGLSARFAGQPLPMARPQDGAAQAADADGMKNASPETRVARDAQAAGAVLSSRTAPGDARAMSADPDGDDTLAFRSLQAFLAGDGDEGEASVQAVAADDVLLGTDFVMTRDAGHGLSHGFWGRAARSGFSGREGETSVEGTVTGVLLGTDWKRKGMAFGVIVSESRSAMTYGGASSGAIDARLSALVPWAGLEIGKHSSLWGAAGIGRGDMTLRPDGQDPTVTGIGWSMAALGAEGALAPGARLGGASLGWHADALATRAESDAARTETGNLAAGSGATTRMRLGLRAAWQRTLASGATLSPRLEAGVRHDGGDAETGIGLEVGGGIAFADPARGLSMSVDARTLALHEDGNFKDWGLSLGLSWDPRPETKRGCSATAQHGLGGASAGGVDALFGPEAFPGAPGAEGGSGWSVEAACGTGRGRGMVGSPYARASGGGEAESLRVGYRIEPDADHASDATVQAWADPSTDGGSVGAGLEWRW